MGKNPVIKMTGLNGYGFRIKCGMTVKGIDRGLTSCGSVAGVNEALRLIVFVAG
ncbi:MAG: hypothetical protein WC476_02785 [Phycisphaerae bacterium]